MSTRQGTRARLGGALLAALGALALLALPSIAAAKDRNHDRIPDRWEKRHHLSLKVDQAGRDQDRDHLGNRGEFRADDNPRDRDSDDDGVMDGDENAGTIASFDAASGRLTITLYGGGTVSGVVTDETEIECSHDSPASASRHGEDEDNSGPGNSGDDDSPSVPPTGTMPEKADDDPVGDDGPHHDADDDGPDHDADDDGPDHAGNREDGDDDRAHCTTAALVVGAVVDEAELRLSNGVATFEEVELERSSDHS